MKTSTPNIAALIVAAGRGTRAGGGLPKQWRPLGATTVADTTVQRFRSHAMIARIGLVIHPDDHSFAAEINGVTLIHGRESRDGSVRAGLEALDTMGAPDLVLIHDVARPLVSHRVIDTVIDALATHRGAAPALAVTDALWRGENGLVSGTQDRAGLYRAQTPQGFHFAPILAAHQTHPGGAADDVEVARAAGLDVAIVAGEEQNLKITTPEDFARAELFLKGA